MGVSIYNYRICIGTYNLKMRGPKQITFKSRPRIPSIAKLKPKTCTSSQEVALCLLVYLMIYLLTPSTHINQSYNLTEPNRYLIKPSDQNYSALSTCEKFGNISVLYSQDKLSLHYGHNPVDQSEKYPLGIKGPFPSQVNKTCHILYGNRRNIGYNYLTWNCDKGFISQNKLDDVKVAAGRLKPHIIGISEVNLKRSEVEIDNPTTQFSTEQVHKVLFIPDYKIILPDSWTEHGVARIIVYVKDDLKVKVIHGSDEEKQLQEILIEIGYGRSKPHFFSFFYREWTSCVRQSNRYQAEDLDHLLNNWRACTAVNKDFIAMGDMNICAVRMDTPNYEHANLANQLRDFLLEEDCTQLIDQYTRIRKVKDTIQRSALDHAVVNCIQKISTPVIVGIGKSDHLGIFLTKSSREIRSNPRTTKKRVYKNFDSSAFRQDMIAAKNGGAFIEVHNTDDENKAFETFEREYSKILNKHAPIKVIQNRSNYCPYIDKDLKKLMEERDYVKEVAIKTGNPFVFDKYKVLRNSVSTKLKNAEPNYYKSKFENAESSADIWKSAKQVLGKVRSSFPTQILAMGKLISNPQDMATAVNEFFLTKIRKLKEETLRDATQNTKALENYMNKKSFPEDGFRLKEVSTVDLLKIVKKMKGKKSCGLDWICGFSLKLVAKDLIEELQTLINLTIRTHRFTEEWKKAKILPGFKNKGNRFDLKFYRPLSNLSEVSKLAEKVVFDQVYDYLDKNDLIHPNHHGFLKNCSTTTALQQMLDLWLKSIDNGKLVAALFLDLSAGFDVINHDLLLDKLKFYKFSDGSIEWFESYLKGREQSVQVESAFSPLMPVPWGVPQGSILGPLLFLLFINELPEVMKVPEDDDNIIDEDAEIVVYADDNTPSTAAENADDLQKKIQSEADCVTSWFQKNDMICSSDKTKLLIITTYMNRYQKLDKPNKALSVNVCGESKDESISEKLLGITVNNQATWKHHYYGDEENQGLMKQLSKRIGMLKQIRRYVSDQRFKLILNGLFTSKLIYGITVWGAVWGIPGDMDVEKRRSISTTKEDMRKLQVLQNKALRLYLRKPYDTPTSDLLLLSNQLSVHQLVAYHSAVQVFKIRESQKPSYHFERLFARSQSSRYSSSSTEANRIDYEMSLARNSFFFQASRIWNSLPQPVQLSRNVNTFKSSCKTWVKRNIAMRP